MAVEAGDLRRTYMEAIRSHVCRVCLDSRDDGRCSLSGSACAIESHLPEVVEAVLATRSLRMDEYYDAIQARVCSGCAHQNAAGTCNERDARECALQTYLPFVVDAVEAVERPAHAAAEACCA
jgi:hypothetical protein